LLKNKLDILDMNMECKERDIYLHMHDQDEYLSKSNGFSTVSSNSLIFVDELDADNNQ